MMDGRGIPRSVGPAQTPRMLGFIINPIAGMGGRVALHGTDGSQWRQAAELGAHQVAPARADRALARLARTDADFTVLAAPGVMGADAARVHGLRTETTGGSIGEVTTTGDTLDAAVEMLERGVTLLLFAGGDGTARDIVSVVGERIPVLGIPSGVKMHSGVFGTSPEAAGDTAAGYVMRPDPSVLFAVEVLDVEAERQTATIKSVRRSSPQLESPTSPTRCSERKRAPPCTTKARLKRFASRSPTRWFRSGCMSLVRERRRQESCSRSAWKAR